jgi:hypothetical protein
MTAARVPAARRWEIAAYLVQLPIAVAVFATAVRADHFGSRHIDLIGAVLFGLLSAAGVLGFGWRMVGESAAVRHPHWANKFGYLLILTLCAVSALKGGNPWDLGWLITAFFLTAGTCGGTAVRYGEALLPVDPRSTWEPISERAFYRAWEDLTRDRAEVIEQLDTDPRLTIWALPLDITGALYDEPLPFMAQLGPIQGPVGHCRFTLATDSQEVAR